MYSFFSDRYPRWVAVVSIICALLVVLSIGLGVLVSEKPGEFLVNLLPGLAEISGGLLITLLIVDSLVRHYEKRRWDKIRDATYKAITAHLRYIVCDMLFHFPVRDHSPLSLISAGPDHPYTDTINGMAELASLLRQLPDEVTAEKSTSDLSVELYEQLQWDLDQIQYVLTPRVIQSSDDQRVIDSLIEFDTTRRSLHNAVIAHKQILIGGVLPDMIALLEQAQTLYSVLCEQWDRELEPYGNNTAKDS